MLYMLAILLVVLSWNSVPGVVFSFAVGRIVGMVFRFAIGTRNQGVWGQRIVEALRSIGLDVASLVRRPEAHAESGVLRTTLDDDLSENSRIYDMLDGRGRRFTVSVLDGQSHNAGYLNQLWEWLRLTGVTMRRDRSASDAVHHHLTMLLGLNNIGLSAPRPYGIVDSGESSLLVLDADSTALPCNLNTLSDDDAIALMRYLDVAHRRGFSHHRITPDTLGRLPIGTPIIAGWHNGDCTSTNANMDIDKVQLLALLAALIGVDRTVSAGRRVWGDETMVSLLPFVQKAAIPAATRALNPWNKQLLDALRDALRALAPQEVSEAMEPVTISRFNIRSFVTIVLLIIAVSVIFTQLRPDEVIDAVSNANPVMAVLCVAFGLIAWAGSAVTLGAFMDPERRDVLGLFCSQAASGFTAVSMPAGVGPAFVNLQFLRKSGYRNTAATAIMSAVWAIQGGTTIAMVLLIGIFTGRNMLSGMIPTNTLIIAIATVALLASAAMAIPPGEASAGRTLSADRQVIRAAAGQRADAAQAAGDRTGRRAGAEHRHRIGVLGGSARVRPCHQPGGDHVRVPARQRPGLRGAHAGRSGRGGGRADVRVHLGRGAARRGPVGHAGLPRGVLLAAHPDGRPGHEMVGPAQSDLKLCPFLCKVWRKPLKYAVPASFLRYHR